MEKVKKILSKIKGACRKVVSYILTVKNKVENMLGRSLDARDYTIVGLTAVIIYLL